jgi:hypothetical protein
VIKRKYLHATTTFSATTMTTATTKTKGIKAKLSGNVEWEIDLNQNTLCACKFSKGYIRNTSGTA